MLVLVISVSLQILDICQLCKHFYTRWADNRLNEAPSHHPPTFSVHPSNRLKKQLPADAFKWFVCDSALTKREGCSSLFYTVNNWFTSITNQPTNSRNTPLSKSLHVIEAGVTYPKYFMSAALLFSFLFENCQSVHCPASSTHLAAYSTGVFKYHTGGTLQYTPS